MPIIWTCIKCNKILEGRKLCCGSLTQYFCQESKSKGSYNNFWRHKQRCLQCSTELLTKRSSARKSTWIEWSKKQEKLKLEIGLYKEEFCKIESLCHERLESFRAIQIGSHDHPGSDVIDTFDLLLLTLNWLWRYYPVRLLALNFSISRGSVQNYISMVLIVLDDALLEYRKWNSSCPSGFSLFNHSNIIGLVDSFPICIPRPQSDEERKRFFIFKKNKTQWGWKIQVLVSSDLRILDVSSAFPYGTCADITVYRNSFCFQNIDIINYKIMKQAHPEHKARDTQRECIALETELNQKKHIQSDRKMVFNLIGDRGYIGLPFLLTPYKKRKSERFSDEEKERNKLIASERSPVEQMNKRFKDFKVIGTIYRGERDARFVSMIIRVIASIINYKLQLEPLHKNLKRKHSDTYF